MKSCPLKTLVIDNGSSEIRAGWAISSKPTVQVEPLVIRHTKPGAPIINSRLLRPRSPFDNGIIINSELMEVVLDNIFDKIFKLSNNFDPPTNVLSTEPVCAPYLSRALVAELLHETYSVDYVTFGIDSMFSLYQNIGFEQAKTFTGTILSLSASASTILPLVNGKPDFHHATRVPVGCFTLAEYMRRLLIIKNSSFSRTLSYSEYMEIVKNHCYVAKEYAQELGTRLRGSDVIVQYKDFPHRAPAIAEHVKLNVEEQESHDRDKYSWIMSLVKEHQLAKKARNTASATMMQRRKAETKKKLRNVFAMIENSDEFEFEAENVSKGRKKKCVTTTNTTNINDTEVISKQKAEEVVRDETLEETGECRDSRVERLLAEYDQFGYYQLQSFPLMARLAYGAEEIGKCPSDDMISLLSSDLRLNLERIRVPELFFEPRMMAINSRGISEALSGSANVFCTGGGSFLPGLPERLIRDLNPETPAGKHVVIKVAENPVLDAWRGAARIVRDEPEMLLWSTRNNFAEFGENFFIRHSLSNEY